MKTLKSNSTKDKKLDEPTRYEFEKNIFIVEPVFNKNTNDTLGTVLLRLINSNK